MMNDFTRGSNRFTRLFFRILHGIKWRVRRLPGIWQILHYLSLRRRDNFYLKKMPAAYLAQVQKPVDPKKVLFVVGRGDQMPDSFSLLYDRVRQMGYDVKLVLLHQFDPAYRFSELSLDFAADAADAAYLFLEDASVTVSSLPLRKETRVINTWHGCGAFKMFGKSTTSKRFGASAEVRRKHFYDAYRNLNLVTVSSPEVVWAYEQAMDLEGQPGTVVGCGVSRTDVFFDPSFIAQNTEEVHRIFPASRGKKILLYAPTFRGRVAGASTPDFKTFDLRRLKEAFGDSYVVVIKHHPYVGPVNTPKIPKDLDGTFAMDLTHVCRIDTLLCAADLCVTDYSSLIFEYSLLGRPLLFYAYDLKDYDDWRGFYYNYDQLTPGPVVKTMEELIDAIRNSQQHFDQSRLEDFRQKFMRSCDGHSTDRILKLVFDQAPSDKEDSHAPASAAGSQFAL